MDLNIRELRLKHSLSQQELADKTGIPKGRINGWEQQGSQPKKADFDKLTTFFNSLEKGIESKYSQGDVKLIPFYDAVAVGGSAIFADQSPVNGHTEMIDPGSFLRKATGSLRIYGHSMFPKYPAGCIVAFRDADKEVIIWGEDYVIELEDRRIIKRLERCDIKDCVKAVSYNKSEEYVYAPIEIPIGKVKRLFMVLGKIELEASI